jgi:hypothetical protein
VHPCLRHLALLATLAVSLQACKKSLQPSTLVLLTNLEGQLEGCPCDAQAAAGMEHLVGALEALRPDPQAPLAMIVGGNTFYPAADAAPLAQQTSRAQAIATALQKLGPMAIVPGTQDSGPRGAALQQLLKPLHLSMLWHGATQSTFALGGIKLGILGVEPQADFASLQSHAQAVRAQGAQFVVAVVADAAKFWEQAPKEGLRDLSTVNVLVEAGRSGLQGAVPRRMGTTLVVAPGRQGAAFGVLRLRPSGSLAEWTYDPDGSKGSSRDSSFTYDSQSVSRQGATAAWVEKLQLQTNQALCTQSGPQPPCPPKRGPNEAFVGSAKCVGCHAAVLPVTQKNAHARAWDAVQGRNKTCDVSCAACHSTGFRKPGGFCDLADVKPFEHVGCEACHGPGSGHVAHPTDRTQWGIMSRTVPEATCRSCHTPQTSPRFVYPTAQEQVLGPGHHAAGQELPAIHHVELKAPTQTP